MQAGAHACVLASHVPPACLPCSGNPAAGTGGGDAHALRAFGMKALSHMALDAVQVVALIGAVAGGTLSFFFVLEGERGIAGMQALQCRRQRCCRCAGTE